MAAVGDQEIREALPKINGFRKASEVRDDEEDNNTQWPNAPLKPWEVSAGFVRLVVGTSYGRRSTRKQEMLLSALLSFEVRANEDGMFMHVICPSDKLALRLARIAMSSAIDWTLKGGIYAPRGGHDGSTVIVPVDLRMLVL